MNTFDKDDQRIISLRFLLSPSSFKGSLHATEAAAIIAEGITRRDPSIETILCPVADGGEGTLGAFQNRSDFVSHHAIVRDPLRQDIEVPWGTINHGRIAVIESATCIGLPLVAPELRNPISTSTHGLGDLILEALKLNPSELIIGLGGSATNDCGLGMLEAFGIVEAYDRDWDTVKALGRRPSINRVRLEELSGRMTLTVLADVSNPLTGPEGATHVYGTQKGADQETIDHLEEAIHSFASQTATHEETGQGAGAAGGLGFALSLCGGKIVRGAEYLLDMMDFDKKCQTADIIITGEGRIDRQTHYGKALNEVITRAKRFSKPVIAFAGHVDGNMDTIAQEYGLDAIVEIATGMMEDEAMKRAPELLKEAAFNYGIFLWKEIGNRNW